MKGNFAAIALVIFGMVALAVNLGFCSIDFVALLRTWWPAALIALGVALHFAPGDTPEKIGAGGKASLEPSFIRYR